MNKVLEVIIVAILLTGASIIGYRIDRKKRKLSKVGEYNYEKVDISLRVMYTIFIVTCVICEVWLFISR